MKPALLFIVIQALCAYSWAQENHHIVSKITDRYVKTQDGKMVLNQSTYLVGYFKQGENGMPTGILTEAKTVKHEKVQLTSNMRRMDQVLEIANQMSGQKFEKASKKISDEICENDGPAKNCFSAIELSL